MHYVYILRLKNGDLYKGSTENMGRRMQEHLSGNVLSTKGRGPILIHHEVYELKSDALRREHFLKTTEGMRLLRQQIRDILAQHSASLA